MRVVAISFLFAVMAASSGLSQTVQIETGMGSIEVQLEPAKAPVTVRNFLRYVDDGRYDHGRFHRTVLLDNQPDNVIRIEVIQGGARPGSASDPPIELERTSATGLRHLDGVISMARSKPDSGTSDFFICIGDQPELDFGGKRNPDGQGFAAFGRVTRGMDVVRKIQKSPHAKQKLDPPIEILRVRRLP